jgi:polyisoprenoid-binding protein YceI
MTGLAIAPATAARYVVSPEGKTNEVVFESKAPVESFRGSTRAIQGWIDLDPEALGDSIGVELSVDLASLDTGIDLRNQHMRENHLHTDRYPHAVFRGARLVDPPSSLVPGEAVTVVAMGRLELHGVTRELTTAVRLTVDPETGAILVQAEFVVYLAEFEIPRPRMLFMKLDEKQKIVFEVLVSPPGGSP